MPVIGTKDKMVRFGFVTVWEPRAMNPGDDPKYGVQVMIPKEHKDVIATVEKLIAEALRKGIEKGKVTKEMTQHREWKPCLRDGDEEFRINGAKSAYLQGYMFFNAGAKADQQPAVVDKYVQPIMRRDDFYSGCWGVVDVNFYAYKNKGMGIGAGLNSVMKREDGERLDNRVSAETAFADYKDELGEGLGEGKLE